MMYHDEDHYPAPLDFSDPYNEPVGLFLDSNNYTPLNTPAERTEVEYEGGVADYNYNM